MDAVTRALAGASLAFALLGCGASNSTQAPPHTPEEDAAIKAAKATTPQQQIEQVEKGSLPPDQKATLIRSIREKNGLP